MTNKTLPHSVEAEEYLLSCCMLDGRDVVARCREARITPSDLYDSKHDTVLACIYSCYDRGLEIDISTIAEELKSTKQLDAIGGYGFLTQVSSRIPTTAQVGYFIDNVKKWSMLRSLIRSATGAVEDCYNFSGTNLNEVDDLVANFEVKLTQLRNRSDATEGLRPLTEFGLPPESHDSYLLGANRYISRGDAVLIVSSAGMGKSSMSIEWAALAATGEHFIGIETKRPLKSLVVQAEDSDGDIGEVFFSIQHAHKFTKKQIEMVKRNVVVKRDKINRGDAFIANLRILVEKVKPDLVWLNPLHAFAGCDIANATEIGRFLREGLNKVNRDDKFAFMVVHHTPKPMTGKAVADKKWHEFMYDAAGSAELVNWARAVVTLKPTETEGDFNLILAKRGKRAGVLQEVQGEANTFLEPTTKIPLRHCKETVEIEGRSKPFNVISWETRVVTKDEAAGKPPANLSGKPKREGQFGAEYDNGEILSCFPASDSKELQPFVMIQRLAREVTGVSPATFSRRVKKLRDQDGLIEMTEDLLYRRTAKGDESANEFLKKRK